MISQLLLTKILQLFVVMILGFVFVKTKMAKSEDSLVLSKLSLYLFMPSVIVNAFNIKLTADVASGLTLAFVCAITIHIVLIGVDYILKRVFGANGVERASVIYSNAGNLIVPIVTYVLGSEWVIYSSAFLITQIVFLWTHGIGMFSDEKTGVKKILLNVNVIAVFAGFILMLSGIGLPSFVSDITSSLGSMIGPVGMLVAGMLAADIDFKKMLSNKRLYFVLAGRLVICPLIIMALMKCAQPFVNINNAHTVMLISYLACITPTAATVMQFSQIHKKDPDYAAAINAVTTVGCVVTMPLLIMFF